MSPSSILNHEIDNALEHDKDENKYVDNLTTKDDHYDNLEEKRVITGSEKETAKKTGELKNGTKVTRNNHKKKRINKMNLIFSIILILHFTNVNIDNNLSWVNEVYIAREDFITTVISSVDCQSFELEMGIQRCDYYKLNDSLYTEFLNLIKDLKYDTSSYPPDVRAKILLCGKKQTDTLCVSLTTYSYNGSYGFTEKKLIKFIEKYVPVNVY